MELRKRDKLVIEALINQDYCFYQDISRKFYPSRSCASQSLKRLIEGGYISVEPIKSIKRNESLMIYLLISLEIIKKLFV